MKASEYQLSNEIHRLLRLPLRYGCLQFIADNGTVAVLRLNNDIYVGIQNDIQQYRPTVDGLFKSYNELTVNINNWYVVAVTDNNYFIAERIVLDIFHKVYGLPDNTNLGTETNYDNHNAEILIAEALEKQAGKKLVLVAPKGQQMQVTDNRILIDTKHLNEKEIHETRQYIVQLSWGLWDHDTGGSPQMMQNPDEPAPILELYLHRSDAKRIASYAMNILTDCFEYELTVRIQIDTH